MYPDSDFDSVCQNIPIYNIPISFLPKYPIIFHFRFLKPATICLDDTQLEMSQPSSRDCHLEWFSVSSGAKLDAFFI